MTSFSRVSPWISHVRGSYWFVKLEGKSIPGEGVGRRVWEQGGEES